MGFDKHGSFVDPPLCAAARCGNIAELTELVESGVALDATDCDGKTALQIAQGLGYTKIVEYLTK